MANQSQFDNSSVSPVYMSQTEANEVMELWARRQREDAEGHAMVTVHDVAEATQLTPQEVQRFLQEVRSSREPIQLPRNEPARSTNYVRPEDIPLWPAIVRAAPLTMLMAFVIILYLQSHSYAMVRVLIPFLTFWIFAMAVAYIGRAIIRVYVDARAGRELRGKSSYFDRLTAEVHRNER